MRNILYEYFDVLELPVGEVPYTAIDRALRDERYLRKFTPSYARNDMMQGHLASLLYWYPFYIDQLYDFSLEGVDFRVYFKNTNMLEHFEYLFPQICKKLDRLRLNGIKTNHFNEIAL
jgi:hypothetical protein